MMMAVVYPRIGQHQDSTLSEADLELIEQVQKEAHLIYSETRFTNDVETIDESDIFDHYRLRVPCEVLTYELTEDQSSPRDNFYFSLDELRRYRLSQIYEIENVPEEEIISVSLSSLTDADLNPTARELDEFFVQSIYGELQENQVRTWLGSATARYVYYFGEQQNADDTIT